MTAAPSPSRAGEPVPDEEGYIAWSGNGPDTWRRSFPIEGPDPDWTPTFGILRESSR